MRHSPAGPSVRLAITLVAAAACARPEPADLVLRNGKVVTMDSTRPEAQAIAIKGPTIVAVGSDRQIGRYVGPSTEVIDLAGQLAVPGFIEGHGHFMGLGSAKMILDLTRAASWEDIVAMVAEAARTARPGEWIRGRGWHQEKWTSVPEPSVDGVPLHGSLSRVSPNNPVYLTHASGHAAFVNARALQLAGITRATRNPPGGEIVRDASGNPTGLLRETAQRLVGRAMDQAAARRTPADIEAEMREQVRLAGEDALSKGVTSFHDAGAPFELIDFYKKLESEGALPVRLYVMVRRESNDEMAAKLPQYRMVAEGNDFLTVRSIKRQIDGALGSHGAWLLEPYTDMPTSTGLVLEPVEDIARTAEIAIQHGFQVNTHAIGDRANREVLNIYARVFAANPDKRDLRWRIEHAQHLHPDDIRRFAELGVIASMQGVHATSDGPWVPKRLGDERSRTGAYVWRSLLDAGAVVTNGTDVPVEDIDPIASFYASVTRMTADGKPFYPEQRMTRQEALRSYTLAAAYSAFEEGIKGSLTPGKLADVTVLSKDIMTIPDAEIPTTQVVYTIVGGKVAFRRAMTGDDRR
ncbi:MAG TPA: amidohydrolase [Gemmatimonadales bacterium]|nr:amidohydrolase [Gemmatimonadales bacterium]